jgi:hypothetical protein
MKIIALSSVLKSKTGSIKVTDSRAQTEEIPVRRFSSHTTVKKYTNFNSLKLENMDILSKLQNTKFNVIAYYLENKI